MITLRVAISIVAMLMSLPDGIVERGGITFYYGEPFEGSNLKCPGHKYERATGPWIAVDIGLYIDGTTRCGDEYIVIFSDGSTMRARALDSGYLGRYKVWDSGLPFVADLPRYWRDGRETATGTIVNLSAMRRFLDANVK